MELFCIEKGRNRVIAPVEEDAGGKRYCPLLKDLENAPPNMRNSAKGFRALFRRYAELGRQGLTTELFHEVDREEGIWEFIKGRLRVFCFLDEGAIVVLSHVGVKKTPKVAKTEITIALEAKRRYLQAKTRGPIRYVEKLDT